MANIKQQKKRIRRALKERQENLRYRSTIKTLFKRLDLAVAAADEPDIQARARELVSLIDRASDRGAIHKNNAARKKSRVARLTAPAPTPEGVAAA